MVHFITRAAREGSYEPKDIPSFLTVRTYLMIQTTKLDGPGLGAHDRAP